MSCLKSVYNTMQRAAGNRLETAGGCGGCAPQEISRRSPRRGAPFEFYSAIAANILYSQLPFIRQFDPGYSAVR